jgi:hypothetical protein
MKLITLSTLLTTAIAWGLDSRPRVCGNEAVTELEQGTVFAVLRPIGVPPGQEDNLLVKTPKGECRMTLGHLRNGGQGVGPGPFVLNRSPRAPSLGMVIQDLTQGSLVIRCTGEVTIKQFKEQLASRIDLQVELLPDDVAQCALPPPSPRPSPGVNESDSKPPNAPGAPDAASSGGHRNAH